MTTYAINLATQATTTFDNYAFDSFCKGPDGKYYGIKADGLYLLEGSTDGGAEIAWSAGLGRVNFGSNAVKLMSDAYAAVASAERVELVVSAKDEEYIYPADTSSETLQTQRIKLGRGLRENYYDLTLQGIGSITLDDFELPEIKSQRRKS